MLLYWLAGKIISCYDYRVFALRRSSALRMTNIQTEAVEAQGDGLHPRKTNVFFKFACIVRRTEDQEGKQPKHHRRMKIVKIQEKIGGTRRYTKVMDLRRVDAQKVVINFSEYPNYTKRFLDTSICGLMFFLFFPHTNTQL